ncbi:hypothetical protein COO60DRAFT_535748 [Scenedesmus sp. NREL 46B-D3]|nr:hypothetical protein COO60DRAFT_535748 [Scenedesmus sp. NREL 46B-D3]
MRCWRATCEPIPVSLLCSTAVCSCCLCREMYVWSCGSLAATWVPGVYLLYMLHHCTVGLSLSVFCCMAYVALLLHVGIRGTAPVYCEGGVQLCTYVYI